jgi:hypothetical protein
MAATPTAQGQDANAAMGGVHDWVCTLGKTPTKAHHNACESLAVDYDVRASSGRMGGGTACRFGQQQAQADSSCIISYY